jgi:adenine phosphoribosyltransferase
MHVDAVAKGERVLLVDDLIATGGTAEAAVNLIESVGGTIVACSFVIDLPDLGGRARLEKLGHEVFALCEFEGD